MKLLLIQELFTHVLMGLKAYLTGTQGPDDVKKPARAGFLLKSARWTDCEAYFLAALAAGLDASALAGVAAAGAMAGLASALTAAAAEGLSSFLAGAAAAPL